ncbi:hypothetical protein KFL_001820070 [Klebsormidium nitens]|uniref:Solute carrier family 35 member F1 n=1 Tax=Klebsormidium nitens TaxID=105231 RepID=A0A1Y1I016_KLENI|nr:hypothetical protein KFL_001820070 [Klebsormidium nitens]|eukprot:GAQ84254.1 hypothetical protein KFL_001820070 [Klebsormidium nitens]
MLDNVSENMGMDAESQQEVLVPPSSAETAEIRPTKERRSSVDECVFVPVLGAEAEAPSSSGREGRWPLQLPWNLEATKGGVAGLALGQFLSLLVTATGLTSAVLAQKGVNIPTTQGWLNYLLLTIVYGGLMLKRKKRPQVPWYVYALLALIDVEANFLVVRAYQYTSITSVMLLDCFTIPCVLLLTRLVLKTRYAARHFAGVALCLSGLVLLVLSDVHSADRGGGKAVLVGDLLVLAAATLYAGSNVGDEALVKQVDRTELLAMVGAYGLAWNTLQLLLLERRELALVRWSWGTALPFGGFSVALFAFYSLVPFMLQMSGSALFNLSLLTSDMWAVAVRALVFRQPVDWLYFVAFFAVSIGLVLYTRGEDEEKETGQPVSSKYLRLDTSRESKCSSLGESPGGAKFNHSLDGFDGVTDREGNPTEKNTRRFECEQSRPSDMHMENEQEII